MSETLACQQCGRQFVPVSRVQVYCQTQCRWDARNQRTKEETRNRAETGFAWPPVRPAPVKVPDGGKRERTGPTLLKGWKTALVIPDQQFGYRRNLHTGALNPFHDPRAIDLVEQVAVAEQPDLSVMLGDIIDCPMFGRFAQEPEFAAAVQPGFDRGALHIATIAENSKRTTLLKGNHDLRIETYVMNNAMASAGLRRARRPASEYPVMTMEFLLGIDDMHNVTMQGAYPGGEEWINDNLLCKHGDVTGPSSKIIETLTNRHRRSVIIGHIHRYIDGITTLPDNGRPLWVRVHSPGCLCRIDGAVPSAKSSTNVFGHPAENWENWQQGFSVVRYVPGDGPFDIEFVPIWSGVARHRGQTFTSKFEIDSPQYDLIPNYPAPANAVAKKTR